MADVDSSELTDRYSELRMLVQKATPGPWWIDSHGHTMIAMDTLDVVFSIPSTKGAVRHPETGNLSSWRNDWDASYIAAANPKQVASLLASYDALLLKAAELELLADDARGKRCPECSAPMVSLSTIDGGQRVCSGCDKVWSWHLKEGQPPLIGNNRMVKKV